MVVPPIIKSRPAPAPCGVASAVFQPRRPPHMPGVRLTPHPVPPPAARATFLQNAPNRPSDGPILLSDTHVANLGTYIARDVGLLQELGWERFIRTRRGKSDLNEAVGAIRHPARSHLRHLRRRGARVPMATAPWSPERRASTLAQGPHKSAFEHAEFLGDELVEFILKGQWIVLPYSVVKTLPRRIIRQLRISPMGVVPQRDRRPRVIVDYSFFGVNQETTKLAPREAMQFGKALERILFKIVASDPAHGPVHLLKIDIADGFYRIWLNEDDIPTLAVLLPRCTETNHWWPSLWCCLWAGPNLRPTSP